VECKKKKRKEKEGEGKGGEVTDDKEKKKKRHTFHSFLGCHFSFKRGCSICFSGRKAYAKIEREQKWHRSAFKKIHPTYIHTCIYVI
jgi:hypothetical protein